MFFWPINYILGLLGKIVCFIKRHEIAQQNVATSASRIRLPLYARFRSNRSKLSEILGHA